MDADSTTWASLPTELLLHVLRLSLQCHPTPSAILRLNYSIYLLAYPLLYQNVCFRSTRGMAEFAQWVDGPGMSAGDKDRLRLPVRIKTINVEKVNEYGVFDALKGVFERRIRWLQAAESDQKDEEGLLHGRMDGLRLDPESPRTHERKPKVQQVELDVLSLCLHSHTRNPRLEAVYESLALVNPIKFIWTGPDPDHHFSTAVRPHPTRRQLLCANGTHRSPSPQIVPQATFHLFQALRHWPRLTHLKLTNIAFPNFAFPNIVFSSSPLLPNEATMSLIVPAGTQSPLPRGLTSIYIGQATFVPAELIARIACAGEEGDNGLKEVRLVDVYVESIWERRMRRGDVERAGVELLRGWWQEVRPKGRFEGDEYEEKMRRCEEEVVRKIQSVVRCEAKTERIMGGDRVERVGMLE